MPHRSFQNRLHIEGVYNTHSISVVGAVKWHKSGTLNFLYGQEGLVVMRQPFTTRVRCWEGGANTAFVLTYDLYMNNIVSTSKYKEKKKTKKKLVNYNENWKWFYGKIPVLNQVNIFYIQHIHMAHSLSDFFFFSIAEKSRKFIALLAVAIQLV